MADQLNSLPQDHPIFGLSGSPATAGEPLAQPAAQTAMPTADNPNVEPLFGQVAYGQKFTLGSTGQQGAFAASQPSTLPGAVEPASYGTGEDGKPITDPGAMKPTGVANPNYVASAGVTGNVGDQRAGLKSGGFGKAPTGPAPLSYHFGGIQPVPRRGGMNPNMPAYADGGEVGSPVPPNGQPGLQPPGTPGGAGQPINPQMADQQISDMLRRNPGVKQQIQQHIQQAISTGQIDPHLANLAVQLAQSCLQNPALWPQLRQFAVSRGLCGPSDLPQEYDQGLVLVILTAAKAAEGAMGGQGADGNAQPGQPQPGMEAHANGGIIRGPGTGTSDSIPGQNTSTGGPVKVSNGEFIVPQDVVAAKGKDFFEALVARYHGKLPRQT